MNKAARKPFLRYIIFALILLAIWLFENTMGLYWADNNFRLYLLVSFVTAIGMMEEELPAALFGLGAGLLMDIFTPGQVGFNAVMLMSIALLTSLCVSHFIRGTILTSLMFNGVALILYVGLYWLFMIVFKGTGSSFSVLTTMFLPRAVITFLFSPFIYMMMRKIRKAFIA